MERYYLIEALFILLGLAAIATAIKYPREVFLKFPLRLGYFFFVRPIMVLAAGPILLVGLPLVCIGTKRNWKITASIKKLVMVVVGVQWSTKKGEIF